jgi:hypothetical protein
MFPSQLLFSATCGGIANAEPGCGFQCGGYCPTKTGKPKCVGCPENRCQCKKGFLYDKVQIKCVPRKKCFSEFLIFLPN